MIDGQELRLQAGVKATLLLSAEEHTAEHSWCAVILLLELGKKQLGAFSPSFVALSWVGSLTLLRDAHMG